MKKLDLLKYGFCLALPLYGIYAIAGAIPVGDIGGAVVSGEKKCYYDISGSWADFSPIGRTWTEISCSASLNFDYFANTLASGTGAIVTPVGWRFPDGTYIIRIKWTDLTSHWSAQSFSGETSTTPNNKFGYSTWWPYKIDTTAPTCLLKEIKFKAWSSNNQYYSNENLYYKSGTPASGSFELTIESDDTKNGATMNVSLLDKIDFPILLGANPATQSLGGVWQKTVVWRYDWNGGYSESFDILNNPSKKFCYDIAGNASSLTADANTKVVFEDNNTIITGLTHLILTPDANAPTVSGNIFANAVNGFHFTSWNDWNGPSIPLYDASTSGTKYLAALSNRKITPPAFGDNGAGLKSFIVSIESSNNTSTFSDYPINLSTYNSRVTSLSNFDITHDFRLVDNDINSDWYRGYDWKINSLNLAWNIINSDKVCDMVWNCLDIPTPDIRVVSNSPVMASNTSLASWAKWIKHNLNRTYAGIVSNLSDTHTTVADFEDQYGNRIVPVSGAKKVLFGIDFTNSLWCNQLASPEAWDCVNFTFKNNTSTLNGNSNPSISERKSFNYTLGAYNQFDSWRLTIELQSAVPTKNEYTLLGNSTSLYGSLQAKLQLTSLTIQVDNTTSYGWVGERSALEVANSDKPDYKWSPIINYSYMQDIYPLVEWQEKSVRISNAVADSSRLSGYNLETKLGTNNPFLRFNNIKITAWNTLEWGAIPKWNEYYDILKNRSYFGDHWNGTIGYSTGDTLNFFPKSLWWITGSSTNIAFYSNLYYRVWSDEVALPSLQSWFKDYWPHKDSDYTGNGAYTWSSNIILAEIDIRGISQTRNKAFWSSDWTNAVTTDNGTFRDFSDITLFDIKTEINKNVRKLLTGTDVSKAKVDGWYTLTSLSTFPTDKWVNAQAWQILYFKDTDLTIDCGVGNICEASWKKTIVVENGNVILKSDMKYRDDNSVLWLIIIGNTSNGSTSQLRISQDVTNWVGMVYSEWPVVSVNSSNQAIYNWVRPSNTSLVNQLYWKWSLATKNTIGWSLKTIPICPYGTPEYKTSSCTSGIAQWYDLIYLRRYGRVSRALYWVSNNPMGDGNIPLNIDKTSVKTAGWDSYSQVVWGISNKTVWLLSKPLKPNPNSPLIIEYDPRIQSNPPYWFSK